MDQTRDAFCTDIEQRLNRLACDAILDPAPDAVAAQVETVAADLDAAGMPEYGARLGQSRPYGKHHSSENSAFLCRKGLTALIAHLTLCIAKGLRRPSKT